MTEQLAKQKRHSLRFDVYRASASVGALVLSSAIRQQRQARMATARL